MVSFSDLLGYAGIGLELILLILLIRGPLSYYFPLFLYTATSLIFTLVEGWVVSNQAWVEDGTYFNVYYSSELVVDTLLFVTLISLTERATKGNSALAKITQFQYLVVVLVYTLPFVLFDGTAFTSTEWNDRAAQLANFGAAIVTLGLWTALVVGRRQDRQFLAVAAGLGATVAGLALSLGVRNFTGEDSPIREIANYAHRLAGVGGFAIWCWAFWDKKLVASGKAAAEAANQNQ